MGPDDAARREDLQARVGQRLGELTGQPGRMRLVAVLTDDQDRHRRARPGRRRRRAGTTPAPRASPGSAPGTTNRSACWRAHILTTRRSASSAGCSASSSSVRPSTSPASAIDGHRVDAVDRRLRCAPGRRWPGCITTSRSNASGCAVAALEQRPRRRARPRAPGWRAYRCCTASSSSASSAYENGVSGADERPWPRKCRKTRVPTTPEPNGRVSAIEPARPCANTVTGAPSPLTRTSIGPAGPSISSNGSARLHRAQDRAHVGEVDERRDRADQAQDVAAGRRIRMCSARNTARISSQKALFCLSAATKNASLRIRASHGAKSLTPSRANHRTWLDEVLDVVGQIDVERHATKPNGRRERATAPSRDCEGAVTRCGC